MTTKESNKPPTTSSTAKQITLEYKIGWEVDHCWLFLSPEWCKQHLASQPNFTWLFVSNQEFTFLCRPLPSLLFPDSFIVPSKYYCGRNVEPLELKWGVGEVEQFTIRVVEKLRLCGQIVVELDDYAWLEDD